MPIYEYQCRKCGRSASFLVRSISRHQPPACPKCGHPGMQRLLSRFAAIKGGQPADADPSSGGGPGGRPDLPDRPDLSDADLAGMEKNPRALGRFMRTRAAQTGEPMPAEMDEVVRRLESGEDPEQIEEGLGGLLGDEQGGGTGGGDDTLYDA